METEGPLDMTQFTYKQGQYLAFIHLYRKLHRQGPAEADMVRYFRVSPPSVHQMIVRLEQIGLITRKAGVPRSVRVAIAVGEIPNLDDIED
jgi:DNA-binding MarR family transcriptional regulator